MGAEEDAAARRERLRALRAAKELLSTPDGAPTPATDGEQHCRSTVLGKMTVTVLRLPGSRTLAHIKSNRQSYWDAFPRNGNHEMAEEPALPGPQDAPDEAAKEDGSPTEEAKEVEDDGELPAMKFRNYLPHDEQLRGGKLAPVSLPKFEDPISAETAEPKEVENPFGNIAPKNPNWDLKRDVQKRIDKLERRTQKALAEIALEQQREKEALEESQD